MDTADIRRNFVAHFENDTRWGAHTAVPSASLLLDDPTLLFVNAGMVPFKPYFLGDETPPYPRATSVQKCVRTPDIEDVGRTTRHGTFFEMCGNFSFGDYFKEGAIELAWELVTKPRDQGGWGLEESRLYPSVYVDDTEALELWKKISGLPEERILRLGKKENYWSMGVPGPGGPGSEILYDRGSEHGPDFDPTLLGPDMPSKLEDRLLEIWNLVFMQEELSAVRAKDDFDVAGPLPKKNIDTGMGLERVAFLLQGVDNMYEIDVMFPVIEKAQELTGRVYGANHEDDVRFRVVADHVRSSLMLIGDGVTPGNEGRGYVLRRLVRRAIRSMRLLGCEDPVLPELLPVSRDKMGETYEGLHRDWQRISTVAFAEEDAFRQTLRAGTTIFDDGDRGGEAGGRHRAVRRPGVRAARHLRLPDRPDPRDGGRAGAQRRRGRLPPADERAAAAGQGRRARQEGRAPRRDGVPRGRGLDGRAGAVHRLRRDGHRRRGSAPGHRRRRGRLGPRGRRGRAGPRPDAVLRRGRRPARRPGVIELSNGAAAAGRRRAVAEHRADRAPGDRAQRRGHPGARGALAGRPRARRLSISRAHTATHMVHKAFREALGETATQAGSENAPGRFRFDFSAAGRGARVGDGRRRGPGQRRDPRRPRRAGRDHEPGRGGQVRARWRCSARSTATGSASSRSATGLASCAAAPTPAAPASSA